MNGFAKTRCGWRGATLLALWLAGAASALANDPFSVSASLTRTESGETRVDVRFGIPAKHYLYAEAMSVSASDGVTLTPLAIPDPVHQHDPTQDAVVAMYTEDTTWRYMVAPPVPDRFVLTVRYQGCDPFLCLLPQTRHIEVAGTDGVFGPARAAEPDTAPPPQDPTVLPPSLDSFRIVGRADGYLGPDSFVAWLNEVEAGRGMPRDPIARAFEDNRAWLAVLLILVLGLGLNLTPCVLPMIPINLAIIGAGAQAGSRMKGLVLGGLYGSGMAVAYGILGLVVALGLGQFGALNASPLFNAVIAVVFLILALAMFGAFNLDLSRFQSSLGDGGARKRGTMATAFLFGAITALLAGACVAPVVISVLTLSARFYAEGVREALLLPFLLGAAMALPWPLAGAGLSFLPKPGKWMVWTKVGFGIVILAAALYYGHEAWRLHAARQAPAAEAPAGPPAEPVPTDDGIAWFTEIEPALQAALEQGKPVYVDVWATWCAACLRMDRTTFRDEQVHGKLRGYIAVKFQAEDLKAPEIKPVLDAFGVTMGLPAHIVLERR